MTVGLEQQCFLFLEGSNAVAIIRRQVITHEAPFEVTVSLERYTGPLSPDQAAVGDFGMKNFDFQGFVKYFFNLDFFNFTEQRSVVFQPATAIGQHIEHVTFLMPQDNIVELLELFRWRLNVNDSRVRVNPDTRIVRLENQDGIKSFVHAITFTSLFVF